MGHRALRPKRKHIRFKPESPTQALLDINGKSKTFNPSICALVFSESFSGAGLVVLGTEQLQVGDLVKIKIGALQPIKGEVAWREIVDPDILKVGVRLLE